MISWVLERIPAHSADGAECQTIIVYREARNLAEFNDQSATPRYITASGLACEPCGDGQWRLSASGIILTAHKQVNAASATPPHDEFIRLLTLLNERTAAAVKLTRRLIQEAQALAERFTKIRRDVRVLVTGSADASPVPSIELSPAHEHLRTPATMV